MPFKRREAETTIEDERDALRAQHAALEDLKRQLAERIDAVRERELELHHALADAGSSPSAPTVVLPPPRARAEEAETDENALEFQRQQQALLAREQTLRKHESELTARERELESRAAEAAAAAEPEQAPAAAEPGAEQLARIEARLAELKDAEKLFLRTRDELADRSEAVAARERLAAQKERELDEREDAPAAPSAGSELSEMEARLRRLEQQQPGEQTLGFSGGLKKLQKESRPQQGR